MHTTHIVAAVGDIVTEMVSCGPIEDLHGQLPDGLRDIFTSYYAQAEDIE